MSQRKTSRGINDIGNHGTPSSLQLSGNISSAARFSQKTMQGFLTKRAINSGRNWKRRYFELDVAKATLQYWKKEGTNGAPKGILVLSATSEVTPLVRTHDKRKFKPNSIEIKTMTQTLYAAADSAEERDRWISALRTSIQQQRAPAGSFSSNALPLKGSPGLKNTPTLVLAEPPQAPPTPSGK